MAERGFHTWGSFSQIKETAMGRKIEDPPSLILELTFLNLSEKSVKMFT